MQNALYISLSGQIALAKRLDTISNNVANMSTVGFRAEGINFRTVLADAGQQRLAYVAPAETNIVRTQGSLSPSGNPWDIAVRGSGWIAVRTAAGTAYTRDGRLSLSSGGELQTVTGLPVLDAGLSPITVTPDGGAPVIASDGSLSQAGRRVGAIGLFNLPAEARLVRGPSGTVLSSAEGIAVTDGSGTQVVQGFTEASNSDPLMEMTELIRVQRAFEMVSNGMDAIEAAKTEAIKTLGS